MCSKGYTIYHLDECLSNALEWVDIGTWVCAKFLIFVPFWKVAPKQGTLKDMFYGRSNIAPREPFYCHFFEWVILGWVISFTGVVTSSNWVQLGPSHLATQMSTATSPCSSFRTPDTPDEVWIENKHDLAALHLGNHQYNLSGAHLFLQAGYHL